MCTKANDFLPVDQLLNNQHNLFCNVFSVISYIHLPFDDFIIGYCWREKMPVLQFSPWNTLCVSSSQFVVVGGSWNRMGGFAEFIAREIGHPHVKREELSISKPGSDRFAFYKIGPVLSISVSSARVDWRVESTAKISFSLIVAINSATANHVSNPLFLLSMTSQCWFFLGWEFWPSTEHYNCWVQRNTINCQAELGVGKSCACKQICIFGDLQIWACVGHSGPQQSS